MRPVSNTIDRSPGLSESPNMGFALHALGGELGERRVHVDGELLVGRGEGCDLTIKDPRLSRRHARFFREGDKLYIEDLGSPNGTFVNQKRVKKEELRAGDIVS